MLEVKELALERHGTALFQNVSLTLEPGTFKMLVAPNGYGKTSLLETMVGMPSARVASGCVEIDGGVARDEACLRTKALYLAQDGLILDGGLTVIEQVRWACKLWCSGLDPSEVMDACGVAQFARKRVRQLSKGMRQQASLAVAYASGTPYVLLDEPLDGLDPLNVDAALRLLGRMAEQGRGVLFASHVFGSASTGNSVSVLFLTKTGIREAEQMDAPSLERTFRELYGA